MPHETELITTLALGFGLALVLGLVAHRLKLPPLVGYLLAGVAVGPFTPGVTADTGIASQLAEIGVILLMFGVGMHFSVRDLLAVKNISLPGAIVQIAAATAMGTLLAHFWGWTWGEGLVFGLSLSVASTVVLLRALESRGILKSVDGRIAVGWLIVEDLAMVLALVLLPALAVSLGGSTGESGETNVALAIGTTLVKVAAFGAIMFFIGRRVLPWLLGHVAATASSELFTLSLLAVALGVAVGAASLFDVSFALAAFVAGMVIAESDLSHKVSADALPFQDVFAVLFFVSVGMLFDPAVLVQEPWRVVAVFLVIIFGKSVAAFLIVLLFRYPVKTALHVAASLAQIGEFSFILVSLGLSLDLLPGEAESLVLAGALLSITVNPLVFASIAPLDAWLQRHPRVMGALERRGVTAAPDALISGEHQLHDHVVLVGHGDVGSPVASALREAGIPLLVVEQDRALAQSLSESGIPTLLGDASRPGLLDHAHLPEARLLVVSVGDPLDALLTVQYARQLNPAIHTVVRTHSEAQSVELEELGIAQTVVAEREMARAVVEHTLRTFGR